MTERGRGALARSADRFAVGTSSMAWDGTALTVRFDERSCPLPRRLHGTIRLLPESLGDRAFPIDAEGLHRWTPLAPRARVEVSLDQPSLAWSGHGYLDSNQGDAPLEQGFSRWDWARAEAGGRAAILYDAWRRDGSRLSLALEARRDGSLAPIELPEPVALARTPIWRIARATHGEGGAATLVSTLEDTPFYARSVLASRLLGTEARVMHESLDLDRFSQAWVKALLPFRMPRRG